MENTLKDHLNYQLKYGGITIRLIAINSIVFLLIQVATIIARLFIPESMDNVHDWLHVFFALPTEPSSMIRYPWTILTSIFAHFSFLHFLLNILFLFFTGQLFESLFGGKRLIATYLLGGIVGGIIELLAHQLFPSLRAETSVIVGASASIMALFVAVAIYRPTYEVKLFGVIPVKLIFLAALFVLMDFISLGNKDATAHFAHLGGALIGFLSVRNTARKSNIVTWLIHLYDRIVSGKKNNQFTVKKGGKTRSTSYKSDEEYNLEKKQNQAKTDAILDKIAKSGYDSLTRAEKEFLFKQSNNG